MKKRIAALLCCLSLAHGSVAAAQDAGQLAGGGAVKGGVRPAPGHTPLLAASLLKDPQLRFSAEGRFQDPGPERRSWMERHPVWTGAMAGFGAGVAITYVVARDEKKEFITPISTGAAALFWGGVSAGIGALAGWGVGRNRDD